MGGHESGEEPGESSGGEVKRILGSGTRGEVMKEGGWP